MPTVRARRKFMHSTSSPAASLCFIELPVSSAIACSPIRALRLPGARETEDVRCSAPLAAGDCVEIAGAFGQPVLLPGLAAVLRAKQLAGARDAIDLVGVARMHGDRHHRGFGLDAMVEALPGLPDIVAAVDRPVGAARRRAEAGIYDLRVVR